MQLDYDLATPNMLLHYFPTGLLGIGFTALMASFMSGMAGNVTAFNTVWTYDIYQSYLSPGKIGSALPLDGPLGDGVRNPCQHRPPRPISPQLSTTSWTCSSLCLGCERPAVCHVSVGHVLAPQGYRPWRIHRTVERHRGRRGAPRA